MARAQIASGQERVNLWIPKDLGKKVSWAEKEFELTRSELIRRALAEFIEKLERDRIDREVEDACAYFSEKDKKMAAEWRAAEGRV